MLTSKYCTAWDAFNTPRIWSMVMNEDDALAREQVLGWRRLASSIRSQHQALSTAKADLMAAWPPDQNASAEAFLNELDRLMVRLEAASADADTTATGLDRILNALDGAKKAVEPLWEKYKDKSDDLVPRWFDSAEDEIDAEARNHMIAMERAVSDAVADLRVPDPFEFSVGGTHEWPPPPGPGEGGRPGSGSGRLGSGGIGTSVPHDPVPPLPGLDPIAPDPAGPSGADSGISGPGPGGIGSGVRPGGPDLAGVINPPATLPGLGEPVGTGPVPGGGPVAPPPLTGVPGVLPGGGPVVGGGGAARPPIGGPGRGPLPGRTLPAGAVIGGPGSLGGPGIGGRGVGSPGAAGGRGVVGPGVGGLGSGGVGSPGAAGGRGGGRGGIRPGAGSLEGEPGRGGVGRGAGGPQLNGVGGPGAGLVRGAGGGLRGPGAARGRAGGRRGSADDRDDIRSGGASAEGFSGGAGAGGFGGPVGGPAGGGRRGGEFAGGRGAGAAGGGRGAARAPRPAWLPDDPVGPDRHLAPSGAGGRGQTRSRSGDEPTGFDPDNLWQVAEGVTPVISPGVDDDWHDPGPNVIGRRG
ncbi:hypothetical protein M1L60_17130 [Actinoplanes sp. TRM 88003]|uniref:Uncharacterized protein n=1 Tax=Paractinoplanes aksuensis TaxID=2939490 RepID=A0ABT1DNB8_9ACTN|nr:hypothetical protein [Actinoplanes aksuensis]MCO8272319.1 hypothetical protein [Actinoplanes aksuensis]